MRFGIREICDVVLRAKATQYLGSKKFYKNEPVLYFDTLKTSSLEGASTTVYATGGRGNTRLVAWEGERTLTFTMEDALISPESFSILSGAGLISVDGDAPIYVHTTSQVEVQEANTIVLPESACWNGYKADDSYYHQAADIFIMTLDDNGEINAEPCIPAENGVAEDHKTITCYGHNGTIKKGSVVLVDYYVKRVGGAQVIEITADKFGGNYYLEASTLFRRESDGVDMPAEFIIPNCKVQSNFTFTMAASGDPSTFTFTMDAFPDYTKFDRTHKVLAALQVITDVSGEDEGTREHCAESAYPKGDASVKVTPKNSYSGLKGHVAGEFIDEDVDLVWDKDKPTAAYVYGTLKYVECPDFKGEHTSGNYFPVQLDSAFTDEKGEPKNIKVVSVLNESGKEAKDLNWLLYVDKQKASENKGKPYFTFSIDGTEILTLNFDYATFAEASGD